MPDPQEGHAAGGHLQPLDPPRSSLGCTLVTLLVLAAGSYGGYYYYKQQAPAANGKTAKTHAIPVRVAKVTTMTVPVEVHGVGNVLAYSTVSVTAQVTGQLMKVFFKEGDFVNKGQPLFAIDQRPQQASVEQLEATVAKDTAQIGQLHATVDRDLANVGQSRATLLRDQATARFAKVEEARYHLLQKQGYVTVEQYQQELASEQTANATVNVDRANIESATETMKADEASINSQMETRAADEASLRNAKVQLTYTYITSPVTGRTGGLSVYAGNVVNPGTAQPLVTIYQVKPIYITFAVPEQYLTLIQTLQARKPLEVEVDFNDQQTAPEWGKITFIDNNVDTTTGTIALRGTFPNTSLHLWPGRFVTVTLMLENEVNAVVVPSQAVQPGQNGDYVFVVDPDDTVEMRPVKVERIVGLNSVIKTGVKPGETVVTDGQLQLNPKTQVEILNGKSHGASAEGGPDGSSGSPEAAASDAPAAADSGSPEASASGAPEAPITTAITTAAVQKGSGSPSDAPEVSGSPGDTTMIQHGLPALSGPLAIPTEPLGAGPAMPPSVSPTALGFPGGTGTPGLVMISAPAAQMGGASGPAAAATSTVATAPTGLPGSVNQPGIVTTPGTLNTLQPVALPSAAPKLTVGPPSIPSPGPAAAVLPDLATPTSAPTNTSAAATPAATATAPAATSTTASSSTSNSTATGSTSTSGSTKSSAGGKSSH